MKNVSFAAVLATAFLCASAVLAQAQQMPQPAPELKKLDYFVGTWKTDANMKPGQFGPGGKVTGTDQAAWMEGNFFLLIHTNFAGSMGSGVELGIMGYDPARKLYTFASYNSAGEHDSGTGTVQGDTWTWNSDPTSQMKWRYTQKVLSPNSYSIKFELASGNNSWTTVMEGKAAKQ